MNNNDLVSSGHSSALNKNQQSMFTWAKYKEDVKRTQSLLQMLPDKLNYQVMVPLNSKGMLRGKIVHTNELLVCLGDSYFVRNTAKQASEYCERKLKSCDEMLNKLQTELNLLQNNLKVPHDNDVFGSNDRPEIVEHITEEEDKIWREEHRKREKEYRQKLAELRKEGSKKIESEQDLWERLDQLELEEELEDELQRLHAEEESEEDENETDKQVIMEASSDITFKPETKINRSVIFSEEPEKGDIEPLRLYFKHSATCSEAQANFTDEMLSPSDIYHKYMTDLKANTPVSILKVKSNPNQSKEVQAAADATNSDDSNDDVKNVISSGIYLPEVKEKLRDDPSSVPIVQQQRRVSKFKASRMKNQS